MRPFRSAFAGLLLAGFALPALAQTAPALPPVSHGGGQHAEMRACMMEHLSGLKAQMQQHMQQFRASNPGADHEARKAERRSFRQQLRQADRGEIQAARAACRPASGAGQR